MKLLKSCRVPNLVFDFERHVLGPSTREDARMRCVFLKKRHASRSYMAGVNLCALKRPDMLRFDITRILRDLVYIAFSCAFVFAHAAVPTGGMGPSIRPSIGHPSAQVTRSKQGPLSRSWIEGWILACALPLIQARNLGHRSEGSWNRLFRGCC